MNQKERNTVMVVFFGIAFALLLQSLFDDIINNVDIFKIFNADNIANKKAHRFLIGLNLGIFLVKYFIDDIVDATKCDKINSSATVAGNNGKIITLLILAWTCFMIASASVAATSTLISLIFWFIGLFFVQLVVNFDNGSNSEKYTTENILYMLFIFLTIFFSVLELPYDKQFFPPFTLFALTLIFIFLLICSDVPIFLYILIYIIFSIINFLVLFSVKYLFALTFFAGITLFLVLIMNIIFSIRTIKRNLTPKKFECLQPQQQ